jgi:hypothetical protein
MDPAEITLIAKNGEKVQVDSRIVVISAFLHVATKECDHKPGDGINLQMFDESTLENMDRIVQRIFAASDDEEEEEKEKNEVDSGRADLHGYHSDGGKGKVYYSNISL